MTASAIIHLKLEPEMTERVNRLAAASRRSAEGLMREAIAQYLERQESRQKMKADLLSAWEEYKSTGLHLTAEEADAWLARLEAGEDVDPPPCHG